MPYWTVLLCAILLSLSASTLAYEHQNPPYKKGKMPKSCKIHPITPSIANHNMHKYSVQDRGRVLNVFLKKIIDKQAYGLFSALKIKHSKGKARLVQPYTWAGLSSNYIDKVYWSYLNGDNKKDLIINTRFASIDKLKGFQVTTFYLSLAKGYAVKQLMSYKLEPVDFMDYSNNKKCEYLHLSYVFGDEADEKGKRHNYWAYNVLNFVGGNIRIENRLSRYFPKWIVDTGRYNDRATKWLPEKKKKRLWARHSQELGGLIGSPDTLSACRKMLNRFSGC